MIWLSLILAEAGNFLGSVDGVVILGTTTWVVARIENLNVRTKSLEEKIEKLFK